MAHKPLILLALCASLVGCSKVDLDVVGQWTGGFVPDAATPANLKVAGLRGYLQLYARKNFKIELTTPNQTLRLEGTWVQEEKRITLTTTKYQFENPSEEDQALRKLQIVTADEARRVYGKPLILDLNKDKTVLEGLDLSLKGISGKHLFRKAKK